MTCVELYNYIVDEEIQEYSVSAPICHQADIPTHVSAWDREYIQETKPKGDKTCVRHYYNVFICERSGRVAYDMKTLTQHFTRQPTRNSDGTCVELCSSTFPCQYARKQRCQNGHPLTLLKSQAASMLYSLKEVMSLLWHSIASLFLKIVETHYLSPDQCRNRVNLTEYDMTLKSDGEVTWASSPNKDRERDSWREKATMSHWREAWMMWWYI